MREIAVRLFINEKFMGSYGKGVFNRAIYNGSIELHNPHQKYLVDFYDYAHWEFRAKSDAQIKVLKYLEQTDLPKAPNLLMSWILHYDPLAKTKTQVPGFCAYLQDSKELHLHIDDSEHSVGEEWDLQVRQCKNAGAKLPVLLATNVALENWQ